MAPSLQRAPSVDLAELAARNRRVPPHMRCSYALETSSLSPRKAAALANSPLRSGVVPNFDNDSEIPLENTAFPRHTPSLNIHPASENWAAKKSRVSSEHLLNSPHERLDIVSNVITVAALVALDNYGSLGQQSCESTRVSV